MTNTTNDLRQSGLVERLYTEFHSELLRFITRKVQDEKIAEDILHDIFLKLHERCNALDEISNITSWLYQVTRNAIIDHYRSLKPIPASTDDERPVDEQWKEDSTVRLAPALQSFIQRLPETYRDALIRTELDGIPQHLLAQQLGLSRSGAKSRVQRARSMLKDLLMRCCHFEFDQRGTLIDYHERCCCCAETKSCTEKSSCSCD